MLLSYNSGSLDTFASLIIFVFYIQGKKSGRAARISKVSTQKDLFKKVGSKKSLPMRAFLDCFRFTFDLHARWANNHNTK